MALLTTTIGAYPKPDYVKVPDWFAANGGTSTDNPTAGWADAVSALGDEAEEISCPRHPGGHRRPDRLRHRHPHRR